jgi:diaminohydroxyphosphoribosylaminopyrimidine deaminase / 5-amino-6-(5-phosphoribosylamino)uracil reductase
MKPRDHYWMGLALQIARQGQGSVEPNPMVGCVVVCDDQLIGSGYHQRFGGPHAEVNALGQCDPAKLPSSTVYVTLEPCSHHGKTPPCVDLLVKHRPARVAVAMKDPFPAVAGAGIAKLREHGIQVEVGLCELEATQLNAPYLKLLSTGMPWVIAKWAMTLDGAVATKEGDSKWISNELSRNRVHELRSRVDAVLIGSGTALTDDPLLTTRLNQNAAPKRIAVRVVMDRQGRSAIESKLASSCELGPVMICVSEEADSRKIEMLRDRGCEVVLIPNESKSNSIAWVLQELGRRRMTNVLLEGGPSMLGDAFDRELIDEVQCFVAPKLIGGAQSRRPIGGTGQSLMQKANCLRDVQIDSIGTDVWFRGLVEKP